MDSADVIKVMKIEELCLRRQRSRELKAYEVYSAGCLAADSLFNRRMKSKYDVLRRRVFNEYMGVLGVVERP